MRLDSGDYPRFTLVNRTADDGAKYYGPFGGRHETRLALDAVCAALRLPTCSRRFPRDIGKERPCLNFHMGRCDGFCRPDGPDAAEYSRRMAQATALLEGKLRAVTTQLTEQMNAAAEALDFETAAALRDRVRALSVLTKDQQVIAGICADTDVWGAYTSPARSGCAILHIEDGDLLARQTEVFPDAADSESALLSAVVPQYYLTRQSLPREILLPAAIEDAKANAARNGVTNTEFLCADAGEAAQELARRGLRPDVICVDPPRKGISQEVIDAIAQMSPTRLVYVSCDPATLARDVARLREKGYHLQQAEAADLFPRTGHVETVCLLSKL